jgi:hypothetical protein
VNDILDDASSVVNGLSDEEDDTSDPTFVPDAMDFADEGEGGEDEQNEYEEPEEQPMDQPGNGNPHDDQEADLDAEQNEQNHQRRNGGWIIQATFNPLPAAPPYEPENQGVEHLRSTIQYFLKYIPDNILDDMAVATSQKIMSQTAKNLVVTPKMLRVFIGMNIVMSYMKYPRIRMYWANKTRVPQVADCMSRTHFFLIRNNLTCRDYARVPDAEKDSNKFWKVAPLLDSIRNACLQNPRSTNVSIDEQMIPFHGKVSMRQFVKGKPNPVGLKNFVCASPDGLPLDFFLYQGKGDTILNQPPPENNVAQPAAAVPGAPVQAPYVPTFSVHEKVILKLSETLPEGCSVYMDRLFSTVPIIEELHAKGLHGTGPLTKDRIPNDCAVLGSDSELRNRGRGSYDQAVRDDGQVSIVKWLDSRPVIMASNIHGARPVEYITRWCKKTKRFVRIKRPNVISHYNTNMGGIDLLDRMIAYYRISAKTKRWTVRTIFHFIDFALAASWIERRRWDLAHQTPNKDRLDFLAFKVDVAHYLLHAENRQEQDEHGLTSEDEDDPAPRRRVTVPLPCDALRKSGAHHLPEIPPEAKLARCRMPGCKNQKCRFRCTKCKVFLCLNNNRNCFKTFHEM